MYLSCFVVYVRGLQWLCNSLGYYEFRPNGKILLFAGKAFCEANAHAEGMCDNLLFLYAGFDSKRLIKVRTGDPCAVYL